MEDSTGHSMPAELQAEDLAQILVQMRQTRNRSLMVLAGLLVGSTLLVVLFSGGMPRGFGLWFLTIWGGFLLIGTLAWVKQSHEGAILPLLAGVYGLHHEKPSDAAAILAARQVIPVGQSRTIDDRLSGRIAGHDVTITEAMTEGGPENRTLLFRGLLIEVTGLPPRPDLPGTLLIASDTDTKPGIITRPRIDTAGLHRQAEVSGPDGQVWGIWRTTAPPAPSALTMAQSLSALIATEFPGASLHAMRLENGCAVIAISHRRDLYRIGGLFASDHAMTEGIGKVAADLAATLRVVSGSLRILLPTARAPG